MERMGDDDRAAEVVTAIYRYRAPAGTDVARVARSLAELQSSGAWVELASETDRGERRSGSPT